MKQVERITAIQTTNERLYQQAQERQQPKTKKEDKKVSFKEILTSAIATLVIVTMLGYSFDWALTNSPTMVKATTMVGGTK